jgi:hypothetical protein
MRDCQAGSRKILVERFGEEFVHVEKRWGLLNSG